MCRFESLSILRYRFKRLLVLLLLVPRSKEWLPSAELSWISSIPESSPQLTLPDRDYIPSGWYFLGFLCRLTYLAARFAACLCSLVARGSYASAPEATKLSSERLLCEEACDSELSSSLSLQLLSESTCELSR